MLNPILMESASSAAGLPSVGLIKSGATEERSDELANSYENRHSMSKNQGLAFPLRAYALDLRACNFQITNSNEG